MVLIYGLLDLLPPTFEPVFVPRLNNLLLFLQENRGLTEDEACEKLLGSIERKKYFNKMKTQLRTQLSHHLLASPSSPENLHRTANEDCYKDFAFYKGLLMSGKRNLGIEFAKNLLPRVKKLENHVLMHQVAHDLLFHYANIEKAPRLVKKYTRLVKKLVEVVHAESVIKMNQERVGFLCNTRDSFTKGLVTEVKQAAQNVAPYLRLKSPYLNRLIYSIIVASHIVEYDNEGVIKICDEALASFPKKHANIKSLRFTFLQNKALPLAALGKLDEAKAIIKEACHLAPIGSFNWHTAFIKRIMICFHAGDYQEAYILYKAHRQHKRPHKSAEAYWKMLYGYLYFLIQVGKIEPYGEETFNLPKFLNDMPMFSQDKAGNNINILIIEILIRMQRDQFGKVIDRMDSTKEYARTYTRRPETKRANLFLHMIAKMEAAHFHRSRTELKTQKLLERLYATPLNRGQNMAIEILPYPVLWEEILAMLKDQPRARTVRKVPTR